MSSVDIKAKQASIFLERERSSCFGKLAWIAILVTGVLTGNGWARGEMPKDKGGRRPLAELLNPNGTVNVSSGYRGTIDPQGWQMISSLNGTPQFAPLGDAGDENWSDQFGFPGPGANGDINALLLDGSGNLYAGGDFTQAGGVSANYVAKWNGTSWSTLGLGMNNRVTALAVDGAGNLYAGGSFTEAGGKNSSYIARWNGQSSSPPGKATLVSPSGNISTSTPAYTWNAVPLATWYYLWVNNNGTAKITAWYTATQAGCSSGSGTCSVTPSAALAAGAAQWWIQTWNANGYGPWSDGMTFTVAAASPPGKATLVSPSGSIATATPIFVWNAVPGATWYYLWVNDSVASLGKIKTWHTAAQAGCDSGTGICSVTPAMELANGNGQWWIQTWNSNGYGPWSDGMSFTIAPASGPGP